MNAKNTRGPWAYSADTRDYGGGEEIVGWNVYAEDGVREVIGCEGILNDEDGEANARLIAAAPELLDALSTFVNNPGLTETERQHLAIAALAKATGISA